MKMVPSIALGLFCLAASAHAESPTPRVPAAIGKAPAVTPTAPTAPDTPTPAAPTPAASAPESTASAAPAPAAAPDTTAEPAPAPSANAGDANAERATLSAPAPAPVTSAPDARPKNSRPRVILADHGVNKVRAGSDEDAEDEVTDDEESSDEEREDRAIDPDTLPFTHHVSHFDLQGSLGIQGFHSSTMDRFSEKGVAASLALRAGGVVFSSDRFGLGLLLAGSSVSAESENRGAVQEVTARSLGVALDGRYHFHHRFYGFARITPALFGAEARFRPAGFGDYQGDAVGFELDGSLGLGMRLAGPSDGSVRKARLWLMADVGYAYRTDVSLTLRSALETVAGPAPFTLDRLDLSGAHGAISLALTY